MSILKIMLVSFGVSAYPSGVAVGFRQLLAQHINGLLETLDPALCCIDATLELLL
jgi:hypothetical protein